MVQDAVPVVPPVLATEKTAILPETQLPEAVKFGGAGVGVFGGTQVPVAANWSWVGVLNVTDMVALPAPMNVPPVPVVMLLCAPTANVPDCAGLVME